ncbi:MAG: hypothetical protein CMB80_01055 [Flammeovirgaceae bacterium]|nr:hypothetical protein [Flammeovirgaceae bacterium]|tara:strand:+ start:1194 stop:1445 length:252 start_codon:yes stop_codon:yes gene_type:complete
MKSFNTVNVVVVQDNGVIDEIWVYSKPEEAEVKFHEVCAERLSNWDEYTSEDQEAVLDQGYERFGHGVIYIVHSSNVLKISEE